VSSDPRSTHRTEGALIALIAVVLVGINLRPGAGSIGPLLEEIRGGLDMGASTAGVLTGLPGLCFGLIGALAVALSRRVGLGGGIALGVVAIVTGLIARAVTESITGFLLLSVLALGGMAIGNVLVPAWIKQHGGQAQVMLATVYGTCLIVGGTLSPWLTPLVEQSRGWREALGAWGVFAVLALPLWLLFAFRDRADRAGRPVVVRPSGRIAHSPTALAMTLFFGMQSMSGYVQLGWMPQIYRDAGLSAAYAGGMVALLNAVMLIGGLVMPSVIARSANLSPLFLLFGTLLGVSWLGLLVAPASVPWLWAVLMGFSGFAFPTVIALIPARTRDPAVTAQLSGFVQPIGYLCAGLGPILIGIIHEATGDWTLVLILLAATAIPFTWAGMRVAQPVFVDDELAAQARS
jgi:CP family cyanate transporter-like MFS transporter